MSETPAMSKLLGLQAKREKKGVGGGHGQKDILNLKRKTVKSLSRFECVSLDNIAEAILSVSCI